MRPYRKQEGKKSVLQKMFEKFALLFSSFTTLATKDGDEDGDEGDASLIVMGVTSKTMNSDSPYAGNVILAWMRTKNGSTTYVPLAALLTERQINDMTPVTSPDPIELTNLFYSKMLDTVRTVDGIAKVKPELYMNKDSPQFERDYDFDLFTDDYINPWKNN